MVHVPALKLRMTGFKFVLSSQGSWNSRQTLTCLGVSPGSKDGLWVVAEVTC